MDIKDHTINDDKICEIYINMFFRNNNYSENIWKSINLNL